MDKDKEELFEKVKDRIKGTLEIPAEFAKMNKDMPDEERILLMNVIEDLLQYMDNWEENSLVLQRYHQGKFKAQFQCGKER